MSQDTNFLNYSQTNFLGVIRGHKQPQIYFSKRKEKANFHLTGMAFSKGRVQKKPQKVEQRSVGLETAVPQLYRSYTFLMSLNILCQCAPELLSLCRQDPRCSLALLAAFACRCHQLFARDPAAVLSSASACTGIRYSYTDWLSFAPTNPTTTWPPPF